MCRTKSPTRCHRRLERYCVTKHKSPQSFEIIYRYTIHWLLERWLENLTRMLFIVSCNELCERCAQRRSEIRSNVDRAQRGARHRGSTKRRFRRGDRARMIHEYDKDSTLDFAMYDVTCTECYLCKQDCIIIKGCLLLSPIMFTSRHAFLHTGEMFFDSWPVGWRSPNTYSCIIWYRRAIRFSRTKRVSREASLKCVVAQKLPYAFPRTSANIADRGVIDKYVRAARKTTRVAILFYGMIIYSCGAHSPAARAVLCVSYRLA